MIDEKGRTNITLILGDSKQMVVQFRYEEKEPVHRKYCCFMDYQDHSDSYASEVCYSYSWDDAFRAASELLKRDLEKDIARAEAAFDGISDILADEDVIGDAAIRIY